MAIYDLRSALAAITAREELVRVQREVDTGIEVPNVVRKNAAQPQRPALLFENLRGYPGWRAATSLLCEPERIGYLFGLPADPKALKQRVMDLLDQQIAPEVVRKAPCQENVITRDIDLARMIPWSHGALKGTHRYFQGCAITRDGESGKQNAGIYRACVQGPDTMTVNGRWDRHFGHQLSTAKRQGAVLPVAYVLGPDPLLFPAAACKLPYGADDFGFMGAVRGAPVELVRCISQDLLVPAHSEVVIEGEIRYPYELGDDGPWPEYLRYLGMNIHPPIMRVTAITHRTNPIVYMTFPAADMEAHAVFASAALLRHLRQFASTFVVDATLTPAALFHHAIIQVRKAEAHHEGLQLNVALAAFGHLVETDRVTLVDEDVDIYDWGSVMWAEASRCNPARQVHILPECRTQQNNPIAGVREMFHEPITKAKIIVDATIPWQYKVAEKGPGITFFTKSQWADVDLSQYYSPADTARWVKVTRSEGDLDLVG